MHLSELAGDGGISAETATALVAWVCKALKISTPLQQLNDSRLVLPPILGWQLHCAWRQGPSALAESAARCIRRSRWTTQHRRTTELFLLPLFPGTHESSCGHFIAARYQKLVRDNFPLPHPADVFNELAGHKFYSRLDLASGFWQIRLHEEDEAKTAFCAPSAGQFAWRVLPMGLKIAPSIFARMMQKVLKPFLGKFCVTYLDDIGVYSDTLDEHLEHIRLVLQALQDHHLFAKPSKCAFCLTELDFLGHVVSHNGVAVDPGKIDAIRAWPVPASARDLRSFLGLPSTPSRSTPPRTHSRNRTPY